MAILRPCGTSLLCMPTSSISRSYLIILVNKNHIFILSWKLSVKPGIGKSANSFVVCTIKYQAFSNWGCTYSKNSYWKEMF